MVRTNIGGFWSKIVIFSAQAKSSGSTDMSRVYAAQFQYGHALVQSTDKRTGIKQFHPVLTMRLRKTFTVKVMKVSYCSPYYRPFNFELY